MLNPLSKIKRKLLSIRVDWTRLYRLIFCMTFKSGTLTFGVLWNGSSLFSVAYISKVVVDFNQYQCKYSHQSFQVHRGHIIHHWATLSTPLLYLLLICRLLKVLPEVGVVSPGRLASGQNKACWGERLTQNRICCTLSLMLACTRTSEHSRTQEECNTDSVWKSESKFRLRLSIGKICHFVCVVKWWIHFVDCGYALKCRPF